MRINKKLCITLAAAVIFQASGQCKTLHGGGNTEVKANLVKLSEGDSWGAECMNWGSDADLSEADITIDWTTDKGETFTTYGCRSWDHDMHEKPDYILKKRNPGEVSAQIHYHGQLKRKIDLNVLDRWSPNLSVFRGTWYVWGGSDCSVDVPSSILFDRITKGTTVTHELTSSGKGKGTLKLKPSTNDGAGGTLVNGTSVINYDVAGLKWDQAQEAYETSDIVTPYQLEVKPSGNLAAGTYTGKMVVTLTCN